MKPTTITQRLTLAPVAMLMASLWGLGCGSSATASGAGADAGDATPSADADLDGAGGAADASDAGCNTIADLGATVMATCDPGAPPTATGGAIADGTYVLTESHFFGACVASALGETVVVSQGTVQSLATDAMTGTVTRRSLTFTVTSGATALVETETCPAGVLATVAFSATPTTLTIYLANALGTRVSTFTRM